MSLEYHINVTTFFLKFVTACKLKSSRRVDMRMGWKASRFIPLLIIHEIQRWQEDGGGGDGDGGGDDAVGPVAEVLRAVAPLDLPVERPDGLAPLVEGVQPATVGDATQALWGEKKSVKWKLKIE